MLYSDKPLACPDCAAQLTAEDHADHAGPCFPEGAPSLSVLRPRAQGRWLGRITGTRWHPKGRVWFVLNRPETAAA